MTVSESIVKWLKQSEIKRIDTDVQCASVDTYSLVKEPIQTVRSYVTGKREYTNRYTFHALLSSQTDTERIENNTFGEALENWVNANARERNFPVIEGANVLGLSITTPFCIGKISNDKSVYQMTIAIRFEKER